MNAAFSPSENQKKDILEHLYYEIDMLGKAVHELKNIDSKYSNSKERQLMKNFLLESFNIHFRALYIFCIEIED